MSSRKPVSGVTSRRQTGSILNTRSIRSSMRIGVIGYGAVAAVHVKGLHDWGADVRTIFGPDPERARAFADAHRVPNSTAALDDLLDQCDAAIIASPSGHHFEQAQAVVTFRTALSRGTARMLLRRGGAYALCVSEFSAAHTAMCAYNQVPARDSSARTLGEERPPWRHTPRHQHARDTASTPELDR